MIVIIIMAIIASIVIGIVAFFGTSGGNESLQQIYPVKSSLNYTPIGNVGQAYYDEKNRRQMLENQNPFSLQENGIVPPMNQNGIVPPMNQNGIQLPINQNGTTPSSINQNGIIQPPVNQNGIVPPSIENVEEVSIENVEEEIPKEDEPIEIVEEESKDEDEDEEEEDLEPNLLKQDIKRVLTEI
jgi:peptidoglycan hydrolase-like protein with peptidoglycan-binding domain